MASHADETRGILGAPSSREKWVLSSFRHSRNLAVLHTAQSLMPRPRAVWSSWNYIGSRANAGDAICFACWMNRLQNLATEVRVFVTLNPPRPPRSGTLLHSDQNPRCRRRQTACRSRSS